MSNVKKTQLGFIKSRLVRKGKISRNECLRNYIARLSARIWDLRQDGWEFEIERKNGDYIYKVIR